jgi:hypothetical protein
MCGRGSDDIPRPESTGSQDDKVEQSLTVAGVRALAKGGRKVAGRRRRRAGDAPAAGRRARREASPPAAAVAGGPGVERGAEPISAPTPAEAAWPRPAWMRTIVAEPPERQARRKERSARARAARARGRRLATICGRFQGSGRVPDLRLSGKWLGAAGFDLGQRFEVEVEAGRLTIRAV